MQCAPCEASSNAPLVGLVSAAMKLYACHRDGSVQVLNPATRQACVTHQLDLGKLDDMVYVELRRRTSCKGVLLLASGRDIHHLDETQELRAIVSSPPS